MIDDHYSGCKLATLLDRKGRQNVHLSYLCHTQNIKLLLICNENKEICVANLRIK